MKWKFCEEKQLEPMYYGLKNGALFSISASDESGQIIDKWNGEIHHSEIAYWTG